MPFIPLDTQGQSQPRRSGFTPLEAKAEEPTQHHGFTPLEASAESASSINWSPAAKTIEAIGAVYPVAETAANLATQAVAMPVAGIAGLGATAAKAVGFDVDPAAVVHDTADALTYQPQTELGQHLTGATMYPLEKLAEAGRYAGDKTLDATGSPAAATAVDTAINLAPMALGVRIKGPLERAADKHAEVMREQQHIQQVEQVQPLADEQPMQMGNTAADVTPDRPAQFAQDAIMQPEAHQPLADPQTPALERAGVAVDALPDGIVEPELGTEAAKAEPTVAFTETPAQSVENSIIQPEADQPRAADPIAPDAEQMGDIADARNAWAPGAEYVGVGLDKPITEGKLAEKPIRREDVLIPFMKSLDTTLYEGRVKGKNRLGFYIPKLEAVRIKNKSDLEVAAHEIAHMIDDRVPEISEAWKSGPMAKAFANELRGVSYDKHKVYEGFAEFVRLYMTQPEQARAKAPEFSKWFDTFTNIHQYGPAIRKAQEGMSAWFGQDALHRAQSKIGLQRDLNGALDGVFDKFRQSTVDDLHGLYRMERNLTGKINPVGAYETARNTRGAGAMVDGAIGIGAPIRKPDGSFGFTGKGLEQILEPVAGELDQFLMYAVGKSAHELMLQGREKLFTRAEIQSMLKLDKPEYRKAFEDYQTWNRAILDFAEAHGVVNSEIRKLFNRQQYLPFYRAGQPGAQSAAGGVTGNWSGIKKLTGGDDNLRPILGNITQNAAMLIEASLKNEARAKIVELAKQRGGGQFLVKIDADSRPVKIDKAQVKDEMLKAAGIDPTAARMGMLDSEQSKVVDAIDQAIDQAPGLFEFMLHNQAPAGNVMAVLRNGKPEYYEVADPLLLRAVTSLNRPAQNWVVQLLGWPKRIGQAAITLTPDFVVANLARDTIMASIMSKTGFKPFVDSVRGMASRITEDPTYKEFIANGGGFASYLRNEETFRAHLDRFYSEKGINLKTVLDTPDKLMYGLETIADAFEMSSRLGEYKRMRAQGAHPRHAAYVAREISTDFAMRGDSRELGFLYDTVMFLRPAVVSMDRMTRGLVHDENKSAIAAKAGTLALMSVGLYLLNRDNPEYQAMEDWKKDGFWHFFIPQADGTSLHLHYPKIWEIGALASVAERTMAALLDDEPAWGKSVANIVRNVFNLNFMPQIVAPLYEQATNRNSFTKAPIETPGMENVQPWLRGKPGTSETMKALGQVTRGLPEDQQIPPARAEALLRGYFGTWAAYGLILSDRAFYPNRAPAMRTDELPVVRRFYEGSPAKHTKYETMFYDMLGEAERLHGTIRALDNSNRTEVADEFADDPVSNTRRQLQRSSRNLQAINRDMTDVISSNKPRDQKRRELDVLTAEKNALLKDVVTDVQSQRVLPSDNYQGE